MKTITYRCPKHHEVILFVERVPDGAMRSPARSSMLGYRSGARYRSNRRKSGMAFEVVESDGGRRKHRKSRGFQGYRVKLSARSGMVAVERIVLTRRKPSDTDTEPPSLKDGRVPDPQPGARYCKRCELYYYKWQCDPVEEED